ncbi:MAG TPA: hypothetical protein VMF88_12135 [Bacteroidota bacterium]|nr:hypothetical protein [Bacteroidota bacterium]
MECTFLLSVLLFQDKGTGNWIAQCLEHNIAAQGKNIQKAVEAFTKTFVGQVVLDVKYDRKPLEGIPKAPAMYWDKFFNQSSKLSERHPVYLPDSIPSTVNARMEDLRVYA